MIYLLFLPKNIIMIDMTSFSKKLQYLSYIKEKTMISAAKKRAEQ